MADFYIDNPESETPWSESWCRIAQLAYYFPLNYLRNQRVFEELIKVNFFTKSIQWNEFGVGLGPSIESYNQLKKNESLTTLLPAIEKIHFWEKHPWLRETTESRLRTHIKNPPQWLTQTPRALSHQKEFQNFLIFSYSLTELTTIPDWIWSADSILVIEPSTREDGRRLLQFRADALTQNFQVLAPCTHSQACPLLTHSKKDWCHDRIFFNRPQWMLDVEKHLPFKNSTITMSYLALKKKIQPETLTTNAPASSLFRVTGDYLDEKGKTRQLVCRGSEREFLTFIKKSSQSQEYARGDLITLTTPLEKKGDELRLLSIQ